MRRFVAAVAVAAGVAAVAVPAVSSAGSTGPRFDATKYAGTYKGTWKNPKTRASGPVTIAIRVDQRKRSASLTIDFGGDYLGLGDPPPVTLHGTYNDTRALVRGKSLLFGNYDVTIAADGAIVGLMTNVGGGAVPKLSYTGKLTERRLDAVYKVVFKDGHAATSVLHMTKTRSG